MDAWGRREQWLRTAAAEFAKTGLHATATAILAKGAGISEPALYSHFVSKEYLFKEVVGRNSKARLLALRTRLRSVTDANLGACLERMAEATVACVPCG